MLTIAKEFTFDSAHRLLNHDGLCKNLHGHTYKLIVEISGEIEENDSSSSYGMIMDFKKFKGIVQEYVLNRLDHHYLNEILDIVPTAENIVMWIVKVLAQAFRPYQLVRVVLYETATSYVTWYNIKVRDKK